MTRKKLCTILKFVVADITQPIRDKEGTILLKRKIEKIQGLQMDTDFYYFNPIDKKITHCKIRNLYNVSQFFYKPPNNIHPKLKELYKKEVEKIFEIKSDPKWFNLSFVYVKQAVKSKAEDDESFYFREGFYVMARKQLYFKNASGRIEKIPIEENMSIHPYTEGEFPEGQEYMNQFFHDLANELAFEREEYERLKENYLNL